MNRAPRNRHTHPIRKYLHMPLHAITRMCRLGLLSAAFPFFFQQGVNACIFVSGCSICIVNK